MKKIIFLLAMASVFFTACTDKEIQAPDDFTVSATAAAFKLSDTVRFNLTGNPDNILFYSGESGSEYDKRFNFYSKEGKLVLNFSSQTRAGATLPRNISVLVSTNFNGKYDQDNVKAATWTNITNRAILPGNAPSNNNDVASGEISLDDLKVEGKPMFIAFRYVSENPTTTAQRYWDMGRLELINKVPGNADYFITPTIKGGMFQVVEFTGSNNKWTINAGTATSHRLIHTANVINNEADDDWVISRGFQVYQTHADVRNSINIKDITQNAIKTFAYKYSSRGTYKATFIAMNADKDTQKEIVKEVLVTIE